MIHALAGEGFDVRHCCRVFKISRSGYYDWTRRPPSARSLRDKWLGPLIEDIHGASGGTYGVDRVTADLRLTHGLIINKKAVSRIMREIGIRGLPVKKYRKGPLENAQIAKDLVARNFAAEAPNKLWVTDITEHPTREGKVYCCVVLDAFSRKVVGWSIDSSQGTSLVSNALGMAVEKRRPEGQPVIHSDRGSQFTSWAFTEKVRRAGLAPSMGAVGSAYDNAMMESFWARMQVELLNRKHWNTRIELANAIFEYLEVFHNRRRRHSSLGMLTPEGFEDLYKSRTQESGILTNGVQR